MSSASKHAKLLSIHYMERKFYNAFHNILHELNMVIQRGKMSLNEQKQCY